MRRTTAIAVTKLCPCGAIPAVAIAFSVGAAAPSKAAPMLVPIDSGPFNYSSATGISADGSVVVGNDSPHGPFRWNAAEGISRVGPNTDALRAAGVSADGAVTVGSSGQFFPTVFSMGFRHTGTGGYELLPWPGDRTGWALAQAASGDGSVIVGRAFYPANFKPPPPPTGVYAVRFQSDGLVYLGDLPGGVIESGAYGVSADGSVIVGYGTSALGREAFRYTAATGMVGLGDLSGGTFASFANAVSTYGQFTVGYGNSATGQEAFLHTIAGGMLGLGDLPGGDFASEAKDVSDNGSVVVGTGTTAAGVEALYWEDGKGIQRLWDVLIANGVDPALGGWTSLVAATGVSADGLTVVGSGMREGKEQAFVATIPEPTAAAVLATAGAGLLPRLRRRRNRR